MIELKNAVQEDPDAVDARWLLGKLHLRMGNAKGGIKELERAVELGLPWDDASETMAEAYLSAREYQKLLRKVEVPAGGAPTHRAALLTRRGDAHFGLSQQGSAESSYTQALEVQPNYSDALLGMARLSLTNGDMAGVSRWLDAALQSDPTNAAAWTFKGFFHLEMREPGESESAYAKALEHAPDNLAARLGLIESLIANDKLDQAQSELEQISESLRQSPRVAFLRGALAYGRRDYEPAATELESYLIAEPQDGRALYLFAASLYTLGQFERAERAAADALVWMPRSPQVRRLLAALKVRSGRNADDELDPLLAADPDDPVLLSLKAQSVSIADGSRRGVEYLKRASTQESISPQLLASVGEALLAGGESDSAIQTLQRSAEIAPDDLGAQLNLAVGYVKAGQNGEALELLGKLGESHPEEPSVWAVTGVAHSARGDTAQAVQAFEKALAVSPGFPLAAHNLADIERKINEDPAAARAYYLQVLEHRADHLPTLLALASLAADLGDRSEQIARLEEAIALHPQASEPQVSLARVQLGAGDPELAMVTLQGVPDEGRRDQRYLETLGGVHLAVGEPAQAVESYTALTKLRPEIGAYQYALAQAYGSLGRREDMQAALVRGLTLQPDQPAAARLMDVLFALAESPDEARETVEVLQSAAPDHPGVKALETREAGLGGQAQQ